MKGVPLNEQLYQYIITLFAEEDDILREVVKETAERNFPLIQVSPENGKFLQLLIRMIKAKRVLEIGTLSGYSAIWMARGLPEDGKLITVDINPGHAEVARKYLKKAGLENKTEVIIGDGIEVMESFRARGLAPLSADSTQKFDFIFIDADKERYPDYLEKAIALSDTGGIIAADNALRDGDVVKENPDEGTKGVQRFNRMMADDKRLCSLLVPISDGLAVGLVI